MNSEDGDWRRGYSHVSVIVKSILFQNFITLGVLIQERVCSNFPLPPHPKNKTKQTNKQTKRFQSVNFNPVTKQPKSLPISQMHANRGYFFQSLGKAPGEIPKMRSYISLNLYFYLRFGVYYTDTHSINQEQSQKLNVQPYQGLFYKKNWIDVPQGKLGTIIWRGV